MESTKIKFYGGFANVSNCSFNIYEYDVEDTNMGEVIFSLPVPTSENTVTYNLSANNWNKALVLDTNTDFAPFDNFVIYSKEKEFVEDVLKYYRREILNYFKEKYDAIENTSVSFRGAAII